MIRESEWEMYLRRPTGFASCDRRRQIEFCGEVGSITASANSESSISWNHSIKIRFEIRNGVANLRGKRSALMVVWAAPLQHQ